MLGPIDRALIIFAVALILAVVLAQVL